MTKTNTQTEKHAHTSYVGIESGIQIAYTASYINMYIRWNIV